MNNAHPTSGRWRTAAWIAAALLLHVFLVLREYPPDVLRRGDLPVKGDVSRYFATADGAAHVSGLYGYDPYFMAGYPVGLWNSMGKKGFELCHRLLPWLPLPALFYVVLVTVPVLTPLLLWWGLKRFLPAGRPRGLLLGLALVYWHLDTMTAYFWGYGNVFFPAMASLSAVSVGLLWDLFAGRGRLGPAVLLGVCVSIIFYCHTVLLIALVAPALVIATMQCEAFSRSRTWLALLAVAGLAAALCVWWLVPLLRNAADCVPQPRPWLQSSWKHWLLDTFSDRGYRHHFDRNLLLHAAVVFGVAGLVMGRRASPVASVLGAGGLVCLFLTYAGSYLGPVSAIQPYRFLIPSVLFLLVPAALAADRMIGRLRGATREAKIAVLSVALMIAPAFTAYLIDLAEPRLPCGVAESQRQALLALASLPLRGRLICDDMNLGHLVPYFLRVPVIGGLSTQAFVRERFAGTDDDEKLFGRPLREWQPAELKTYLDTYAVDFAVFRHSDWVAFAERLPETFERLGEAGGYHLYWVRGAAPSLALEGSAEVSATYDRIDVRAVGSPRLVLKLHYARWLTADRGVTLKPVLVRDDPVPFIACLVPAGVDAFVIAKRLPGGGGGR